MKIFLNSKNLAIFISATFNTFAIILLALIIFVNKTAFHPFRKVLQLYFNIFHTFTLQHSFTLHTSTLSLLHTFDKYFSHFQTLTLFPFQNIAVNWSQILSHNPPIGKETAFGKEILWWRRRRSRTDESGSTIKTFIANPTQDHSLCQMLSHFFYGIYNIYYIYYIFCRLYSKKIMAFVWNGLSLPDFFTNACWSSNPKRFVICKSIPKTARIARMRNKNLPWKEDDNFSVLPVNV